MPTLLMGAYIQISPLGEKKGEKGQYEFGRGPLNLTKKYGFQLVLNVSEKLAFFNDIYGKKPSIHIFKKADIPVDWSLRRKFYDFSSFP